MNEAMAVATVLLIYAMGMWAGWNAYDVLKAPKVKRRGYRLGISCCLRFWLMQLSRHRDAKFVLRSHGSPEIEVGVTKEFSIKER